VKRAAVFFTILIFFCLTTKVFAVSSFEPEPKQFFVQAVAGKLTKEAILIKNNTPTLKNLWLDWQGYSLPKGEFIDKSDLEKHSINFASLSSNTLELQPFSTSNIEVVFDIPKNTLPADYYGSLIIRDGANQEQVDFTIRIPGRLEEELKIDKIIDDGSFLTLPIHNRGNQTVKVSADIDVQNFFGRHVLTAKGTEEIKASQIKKISANHSSLLPGYYQAKISLETTSGKQIISIHSFWVRPEFFFVLGAIIFLLSLGIYLKRRLQK